MRYVWITIGWLCVGAGLVGAFLPLLPTTPFLLVAAYAFSKGSQRMHDWLVNHPQFGPPITDWQSEKAISRQTKKVASLSIIGIFVLSIALGVPLWALTTQGLILIGVVTFLWTRNEPQQTNKAEK